MTIRTATAAGKLFLIERTIGKDEMLVQFIRVSDTLSHCAVVRYYSQTVITAPFFTEAITMHFHTMGIQLTRLKEVDQEAAKAIWLLQTGEEL